MTLDWKHWVLSHLIWVVLVGSSIVGFESWKAEHDARLQADATIKAAQAQIVTLQQGIADRDKAAAIAVAPVIKIIHDVQTPQQAVAALPKVLIQPLPKPIAPQSDNSVVIPAPDVVPLFDQVADDSVCRQLLTTNQADLQDTKAIVTQQANEITALKKKPAFWHRIKSGAIKVGIGIAIGLLVAPKL